VLRLLWCLIPLAATVQFAVAVARTDPGTRPRQGLSAVGLGPGRLTVLAAVSTALSSTIGSLVALLFFLQLRGDLTGTPFNGTGSDLLAAGEPLPLPAALTLLALVPVLASTAAALALRPPGLKTPSTEDDSESPRTGTSATVPAGLPWGVALIAAGLAVETYASRQGGSARFDSSTAGVLAGWSLTAAGLALAGPGFTYLCGRLLQALRPGAVRMLAGRTLMDEARGIGRPLGVVCAVVSGAFAAAALYGPGDERPFGPLTGLAAALVIGCTVATLLTAAVEARRARAETRTALLSLGAPTRLLRTVAGVRATALLLVFAPLTWAIAELAAAPLSG
jgi:hypothetical protein